MAIDFWHEWSESCRTPPPNKPDAWHMWTAVPHPPPDTFPSVVYCCTRCGVVMWTLDRRISPLINEKVWHLSASQEDYAKDMEIALVVEG